MNPKINRREFLLKSSKTSICMCAFMPVNSSFLRDNEEVPDPVKLNYCGYQCPAECQFLKGTLENNIALKKEAYKLWKIRERFNVDFDPDIIFCYGCKNPEKPEGIVVTRCTVRECAVSKNYDCCIECDDLKNCEKELWERYPEFKKLVLQMQEKYKANKG